jgi:hypothetical protein
MRFLKTLGHPVVYGFTDEGPDGAVTEVEFEVSRDGDATKRVILALNLAAGGTPTLLMRFRNERGISLTFADPQMTAKIERFIVSHL